MVERKLLQRNLDRRLEQIAVAIPPNLKSTDLRAINIKLHHGKDDFLLQIWDSDGRTIYQSHADLALPRFWRTGFSVEQWQGQRWKLYIRYTQANTIQVAQSIEARAAIAQERALHTLIPLMLFIPVIALAIPVCVERGLRSLNQLSRELHTRNSDALGPVSTRDQPAEIAPLAQALDTLFLRLRNALDVQRKFIADASHELRTPLATLQIQSQVVEHALGTAQQRAALEDLNAGIKRTSHLVEQLLLASRLEAGSPRDARQVLYLDELSRDVTMELVPFASSKSIDLGMGRAQRARLIGCDFQIKLLIRNLIDNAIRYTPRGGRVDVEVTSDGDAVHLIVEDSGPGIPPDDRERVFDRFYRCLGHDTPGSGLGLAMVKKVAVQHGAQICLDTSPHLAGLRVTVSFESAPEDAAECRAVVGNSVLEA